MGYEPTPEQIAQAEEKRLLRLEKRIRKEEQRDETVSVFLARPWIPLQSLDQLHTQTIRVMTWNVREVISLYSHHSLKVCPCSYSLSVSSVRQLSVDLYNQSPMNHRIGALSNQWQSS